MKGSDGKKYYLVEVIGLILKNLKEIIERYFETRGGLCKIEEFDWVITVPALWGERARDMMREAAYVVSFIIIMSFSSTHNIIFLRLVYVPIFLNGTSCSNYLYKQLRHMNRCKLRNLNVIPRDFL